MEITTQDARRYYDALHHIATGGLSPSIRFAHLVLAGVDLRTAHRLAARCAEDPDARREANAIESAHPLTFRPLGEG